MAEAHTPKANSLDGINIGEVLKQLLKPFGILVCGKTGVGKSSLINSLTGMDVCKVSDPGLSGNFQAGTATVDSTLINLSGVLVRVLDSPGLQDGTVNEGKYLDEMYEKCQDVSIVLYCLDMTVVRWTDPEVKATQLLTEKFGVDFWKKSILVLTKANMVKVPGKYKGEEGIYHKQLYENFVKRFRDQLIDQGVPEDIATNVCAVAAGYCDPDDETEEDRYIYYASEKANVSKENTQYDFIQELWITCLEILSDIGRAQFMTMTENRIKPDTDLPTNDPALIEELEALLKDEKDLRERLEKEHKGAYENIKREMDKMKKQLAEASKVQPPAICSRPTVVPVVEIQNHIHPNSMLQKAKTAVHTVTGGTTGALLGTVFFGPIGTVAGFFLGSAFGGLSS